VKKSETVPDMLHRTVLLDEAVAALELNGARCGGSYVDGTFGRGGHSREILARLSEGGRLLAFDKDLQAIAVGRELQAHDSRFSIAHESFAALDQELDARGFGLLDGVLLDLGISSPQVDEAERGFSFRQDGPLDMRMDTTRGMSAAQWLASASQQELQEVIRDYGEERFAVPIAKAIVAGRAVTPLSSTRQLAQLVAGAVKTREKGKDPATRTFQAIRIFINKELEDLETGLTRAFARLAPHGRLVVISFHSLEDRIVKQFMARHAKLPQPDRRLPIRSIDLPQPPLKLIRRVMPGDAEVAANPRARSAVMRVAERQPTVQEAR
jgi:16S rRNA (cytosine1402-N4)-methyltransferase